MFHPSEDRQRHSDASNPIPRESFSPELASFRADRQPETRHEKWNLSRGRYLLRGHQYHSRSEAACGALMVEFLPGFELRRGETFQVPTNPSERGPRYFIDFLFGNIAFEYHNPRFGSKGSDFGDCLSKKEAQWLRTRMRREQSEGDLRGLIEAQRFKLLQNFEKRRVVQLHENPAFDGVKLIVASSPKEFYERVIHRFGSGNIPPLGEFVERFSALQGEAFDLCSLDRSLIKRTPRKRRPSQGDSANTGSDQNRQRDRFYNKPRSHR